MSDATASHRDGGLADPAARRGAAWPASTASPASAKPDPILVVDNIVRQFGGMTAVDVEHLEVQRGMITALIGPNGAGKTTFFNLITGFDKPTSAGQGRALVLRRPDARQDLGLERRQGRHGPHLPAHQGPQPDDGDGQHDAGRAEPARREPRQVDARGRCGAARSGRSRRRPTSCWTASSCSRRSTTTRAASPAASASCSRWRGR